MSCLFDSLAALLVERPGLLASSVFHELRDLIDLRPRGPYSPYGPDGPNGPNGASVRAAICALLARRAIEVHDIALDEWGAMEAGTTRDAYVRGMRDGGTWGGGVEIAVAATALRVPIVVHYGATRVVFWPNRGQTSAPNGAPNGGPNSGPNSATRLELRYTGSHYTPVL